MAKRRSQTGTEIEGTNRAVSSSEPARERDEQSELGNAAIQARLTTEESAPGATATVQAAQALVQHALDALQLDPAQPARTQHLVALIERSQLPDRDVLADRLRAAETSRQVVDSALDRFVGAHDEAARWAVDARLAAVREALDRGELPAALPSEHGGERQPSPEDGAAALVERLAQTDAAQGELAGPSDATAPSAAALSGLCRLLALTVLLDEEEDEDDDWVGPDLELD